LHCNSLIDRDPCLRRTLELAAGGLSHDQSQLVDAQFGPRAKAYVESAVHARGPDLEALEVVVSGVQPARALDLGTGGSYLMARHAGSVTASDLSREMLARWRQRRKTEA
jgi:hypothetical protein